MNILESNTVLVLNGAWVVCNVKSVADALTDLAGGAYAGLDIQDSYMIPVAWDKWIHLPVRPGDDFVKTPRLQVRAPRVIIALNFKKVPVKKKRANLRNVYEHYEGVDALTGKPVPRSRASIEHVKPRSKGGGSDWDNVVLSDREVNSRRGDRPYEEVGLKAPRPKPAPKELPVASTIVNSHRIPEWDLFLKKAKV